MILALTLKRGIALSRDPAEAEGFIKERMEKGAPAGNRNPPMTLSHNVISFLVLSTGCSWCCCVCSLLRPTREMASALRACPETSSDDMCERMFLADDPTTDDA